MVMSVDLMDACLERCELRVGLTYSYGVCWSALTELVEAQLILPEIIFCPTWEPLLQGFYDSACIHTKSPRDYNDGQRLYSSLPT